MITVLDPTNTKDLDLFYAIGKQVRLKHDFQALPWRDDQNISLFANNPACSIRLYIAEAGDYIGRIAALHFKDQKEGVIGWYECSASESTSDALLSNATSYLLKQGCTSVVGPINGDTWNSYRFNLTAEKPIMPGDPYQPAYYVEYWKRFGFESKVHYQSDTAPTDLFEPMTMEEGQELATQFNLNVAYYPHKPDAAFTAKMHQFYLACFENNPLFNDISLERYTELTEKLLQIFNPKHSLLVSDREGTPIAVTLSYEDVYHKLYEEGKLVDSEYATKKLLIKTIATHPEWRNKQIGTLMINLVHNLANQSGYDEIYHLLMFKENLSATKGKEKFVTKCVRRYALFSLEL